MKEKYKVMSTVRYEVVIGGTVVLRTGNKDMAEKYLNDVKPFYGMCHPANTMFVRKVEKKA